MSDRNVCLYSGVFNSNVRLFSLAARSHKYGRQGQGDEEEGVENEYLTGDYYQSSSSGAAGFSGFGGYNVDGSRHRAGDDDEDDDDYSDDSDDSDDDDDNEEEESSTGSEEEVAGAVGGPAAPKKK